MQNRCFPLINFFCYECSSPYSSALHPLVLQVSGYMLLLSPHPHQPSHSNYSQIALRSFLQRVNHSL